MTLYDVILCCSVLQLVLIASKKRGVVQGSCASCQYPGPANVGSRQTWFEELRTSKRQALQAIGYDGGVFDVPELKWTQSSFIQPQMHPYDRYFYDNGTYTVDRFLDDLEKRYGGVDAILMWPTYTYVLVRPQSTSSCSLS